MSTSVVALRRPHRDPLMSTHYTATAKALHWVIALMILGMLLLGFLIQDMSFSPQKLQWISWHKWIGVTIFLLVLVRIGWRWRHPPPPLPRQIPAWQRRAAHLGHLALYALMLVIPLSGWLMSSAKGVPTVWFGVVPLPDLLARNPELGEQLQLVHFGLNLTLIAVLLAHVGAAIKHHVINRDDVLRRMLPGKPPLQ